MIRVGILGATGYTALELMQLLLRHPEAQITVLTSRREDRPHVSAVHPQLSGRLELSLQPADEELVAAQADVVFSCLPHAASAAVVKPLVDRGLRVVDLSADYRLDNLKTYQQWYGVKHPDPGRVGQVVYGLPELYRKQLAEAVLVANPGCFPTSAILPLAPLLSAQLIEPNGIIIDSKTGVTGAGRTPKLPFHFPECNESLAAYGVGQHRHTPEIDQYLTVAAGTTVEVVFTPHLAPMDRGILSTCYAIPHRGHDADALLDELRNFYRDQPFVRIVDHLPATKHVSGTNYCDITVRVSRGRAIIISCLDNLLKGASGAAVQNFNLMCQLPETTALL